MNFKNTEFLAIAKQIIFDNLSDSNFTPNELSRLLYVSRSQLHRRLKALTGQNTSEFIRNIRLEQAKKMLETTSLTVSQIALECGFSNLSWFAKCFREVYGVCPSYLK